MQDLNGGQRMTSTQPHQQVKTERESGYVCHRSFRCDVSEVGRREKVSVSEESGSSAVKEGWKLSLMQGNVSGSGWKTSANIGCLSVTQSSCRCRSGSVGGAKLFRIIPPNRRISHLICCSSRLEALRSHWTAAGHTGSLRRELPVTNVTFCCVSGPKLEMARRDL